MSYPLQVTSVILVIHCENKFLLVKRSELDNIFPGHWQNMGGKIEIGETVEQAIQREAEEELGFNPKVKPIFLHSYSWKKDEDSATKLGLIFLLNSPMKINDYEVKLDSELQDYGWFTFPEVERIKTIGPNSPTGTLKQIKKALEIIEKGIQGL